MVSRLSFMKSNNTHSGMFFQNYVSHLFSLFNNHTVKKKVQHFGIVPDIFDVDAKIIAEVKSAKILTKNPYNQTTVLYTDQLRKYMKLLEIMNNKQLYFGDSRLTKREFELYYLLLFYSIDTKYDTTVCVLDSEIISKLIKEADPRRTLWGLGTKKQQRARSVLRTKEQLLLDPNAYKRTTSSNNERRDHLLQTFQRREYIRPKLSELVKCLPQKTVQEDFFQGIIINTTVLSKKDEALIPQQL